LHCRNPDDNGHTTNGLFHSLACFVGIAWVCLAPKRIELEAERPALSDGAALYAVRHSVWFGNFSDLFHASYALCCRPYQGKPYEVNHAVLGRRAQP